MILGKVGVDGFTVPRRKIEGRYEHGFKVILIKAYCENRDCISRFWLILQAASKFVIASDKSILPKVRVDGFIGAQQEKWRQTKKRFSNNIKGTRMRKRGYCSHFPIIFETTHKFLIVFATLTFWKNVVDRVTRPDREIGIRCKFDLKIILKGLGCK